MGEGEAQGERGAGKGGRGPVGGMCVCAGVRVWVIEVIWADLGVGLAEPFRCARQGDAGVHGVP